MNTGFSVVKQLILAFGILLIYPSGLMSMDIHNELRGLAENSILNIPALGKIGTEQLLSYLSGNRKEQDVLVEAQIFSVFFPSHKANIASNKRLATGDISEREIKRAKKIGRIIINPPVNINFINELEAPFRHQIGSNVIVFWDIDCTLVRPKFLLANFARDDLRELLNLELAKMDVRQGEAFLSYLEHCPRLQRQVILEHSVISILKHLKESGAIIVGLTARSLKASEATHQMLMDLGIDFENLSALGEIQKIDSSHEGLERGIFYTGNKRKKVEYIPNLIDLIQKTAGEAGPFHAYHIDDNINEIDAFAKASIKSDIEDDIFLHPYFYKFHDHLTDLVFEYPSSVQDEAALFLSDFLNNNESTIPEILVLDGPINAIPLKKPSL